jgi:polar amino acid transport system substrate-binding protein
MTMKSLMLGAAVAALALPAAAQALPDRIKQAGKIVIATMPNYPPITYKDPATNKLTGLDIDIGEAIGKELGLKVEWQEIAFAQMLPSLQTGRVDLVMAGMSDLPTRRDQQDFVDYFASGAQFYTSVAMSKEIKSQADLCGKKVGASRSTNWPQQIAEWSEQNCVAKGKPAITVIGTEGSIDARTQLKQQRIDAGVQGSETLPYLQTQEPNTYVILGEPFTRTLVGIPVVKTEPKLRDAVKAALDGMQKKGIYDQILDKHGLKTVALKPIAVNEGM